MAVIGIQPPLGSGPALQDGQWLNGLANGQNRSFTNGLTAHAGGGKASAYQIPAAVAIIGFATVATTGDSALLPQAKTGTVVMVRNAGANSMNLYAKGTDKINGVASATAYALAADTSALFFCALDAAWSAIKTA